MPSFSAGQTITTTTPTIVVDAGLPVGAHQFQLEVIDGAGNRSRPDVAVVTVQRLVIPHPIEPHPPIPGPGPVITGPIGPPIPGPGPVIDGPIIRPNGGLTPTVVVPRSPAAKPRSKRSKPK